MITLSKKKNFFIAFILVALLFIINYFYLSKKNKTQIIYQYTPLLNKLHKYHYVNLSESNDYFKNFIQFYINNYSDNELKNIYRISINTNKILLIITTNKKMNKLQVNKLLQDITKKFIENLKIEFSNNVAFLKDRHLVLKDNDLDKVNNNLTIIVLEKKIKSLEKFESTISDFHFVQEKKNDIFIALLVLHLILLGIVSFLIFKINIKSN